MTRARALVKSVGLCATVGLCVVLLLAACGHGDSGAGDEHDGTESSGEHSEESSEGDEGEESGTQYTKADSYDETRAGARLLLTYDPDQDTFVGTVENTTEDLLDQVRIEVHLSNGVELGPTTPGDLPAGQTGAIFLPADGEQFQTWSAHPEVGRDEHGGQGDEEHSGS